MPRATKTERTVTRSFRISERALKAIEEESKKQNVSVSTILNQQLLTYADYERFVKRIGLIKLSSVSFQKILEAAPDGEIAKVGLATGSDTPRSIILAKYGMLSEETIVEYLQLLSEYATQFEYGEVQLAWGAKKIITLLHRLGPKGSIFFANYVKALFDQIGSAPKISTSDHSVVIEVSPQRDQASTF